MINKYKLAVAALASIASVNCFSDDLSMTLYGDVFFGGSVVEFHGEIRVDEAYEPGASPNREYYDHFGPVGVNQASSLQVMEGYCVILAKDEHFGSTWEVFGPGEYDSFLSLNNSISSAATYPKINNSCNPAMDIPMLYDSKNFGGRRFPLTFRKGHLSPEIFSGYWDNIQYDNQDPNESGGLIGSDDLRWIVKGGYVVGGGFSDRASSLTVPDCYEVTLEGNPSGGGYIIRTFGPGIYPDLGLFSLNNNTWVYDIARTPECMEPEVRYVPIIIIG